MMPSGEQDSHAEQAQGIEALEAAMRYKLRPSGNMSLSELASFLRSSARRLESIYGVSPAEIYLLEKKFKDEQMQNLLEANMRRWKVERDETQTGFLVKGKHKDFRLVAREYRLTEAQVREVLERVLGTAPSGE
jgi:hypothetical protein